ncbi:TonB-dependent receptor [Arsenicibacter rosenii]|uniref:TonB-dependent receptor n=1 Tax=Arsenicibacter rosenii TaxID=1750698 RepID=A0A1S2VP75_9BACT|nr:TonB-dependent receptor [Arsenicibacter rosenii]OIN60190.1 TonB-dependent receptor [Arsenicibacter rosenii]
MKFIFLFLILTGLVSTYAGAQPSGRKQITVSGYVREAGSQEALIGVSIYASMPDATNRIVGTTTNTYGFYSITLPAQDTVRLNFSFVGYENESRVTGLRQSQVVNVLLKPGKTLSEVSVKANRDTRVSDRAQMSQIDIPISQIKKVPTLLGEKDVLKVLQLMPGVQKGSEGQTGIYVRGGGPDQNLIILDDAIVYNANHLFGFFSVFNGDALKSVELTKGGFPARFGGRLSSVIDLNMKEGNKEKLHGEGGIGLISSRLTLEGPIKRKRDSTARSSFLVSARRTYLDIVARPLILASNGGSPAGYYFYDFNAKINYDLGPKDKVYLSGYFGQDRFYSQDKTTNTKTDVNLFWGNSTGTLRWNHQFNEKVFANTSLIFSNYDFQIGVDDESTQADGQKNTFNLRYRSGIRDFALKHDLDYYPNPQHSMRFGVISTYHRFTPSAFVLQDSEVGDNRQVIDAINVLESGIYAEDLWKPTDRWRINAGMRLSHYWHKNAGYIRPEPRLSAAWRLNSSLSLKGSYALMNQYVHLLSNTGVGLPTDLWVPTTDRVKPQQSQQVAFGVAKDLDKSWLGDGISLTVEGYYKTMNNILSYREGASFIVVDQPGSSSETPRWEDKVTSGKGWSYGAEVLLQKKAGRFSGWLGYTLSWTQWQFPELNSGKTFFPRYDRRHDISVVGIYELNPRITLSGTWVYGTGQALTIPIGQYKAIENGQIGFTPSSGITKQLASMLTVNDYGTKNGFRAEPYHRFDLGVQFHKKKKRYERTWEISVYNLYSRRNPFYYRLKTQSSGSTVLQRVSLFPIVPSFSYNFTF